MWLGTQNLHRYLSFQWDVRNNGVSTIDIVAAGIMWHYKFISRLGTADFDPNSLQGNPGRHEEIRFLIKVTPGLPVIQAKR